VVKKTWSKDDKVSLIDFVDAIDTRHKLIKYDECYNWRIQGTSGHVYAIPEHGVFYICVKQGLLGLGARPKSSWLFVPSVKMEMMKACSDLTDCRLPLKVI